jgi:ATP-binding cassette subfamily B protein
MSSQPPQQTATYILGRILTYCRPYWWPLALGTLGIAASQMLAVAIPEILRRVIDRGVALGESEFMLQAGLLVVVLGLLRGLTGFLGRYYMESESHRVAYDIRNAMYDKVQSLPFQYHDTARTGSIITRSISDVDEIQRFLAYGVMEGLITVSVVAFSIGAMFWINPLLAAVVCLPLLPLIWKSYRFAHFVDREWRKVMEHLANLGNQVQETLVGSEVVRAFAREDHEIEKFNQENDLLYQQHLKVIREWSDYMPYSAAMVSISIVLAIAVGGWLQQNSQAGVTLGMIVQFNAYIILMSQPIRFAGFVIMQMNQGVASARRVFEVLDEALRLQDDPQAYPLPDLRGQACEVCFEGVDLRYREDLPYVLKDIHFRAQSDQVVAIVGKTGAGKSSLVSLLPRFYDVSAGRVCINGHDIRRVTLKSLRDQVAVVLQESLLFSATIRENIALGRPGASQDQIEAAARAANAHPFIMEFPQGYETRVGERGITLSGGQRQRIAIARALLMDAPILILDDATSSVDTETESQIHAALRRLMAGRVSFIIAQRLASVLHADQILVVDGGRIVEQGTHESLLALGGVYKEIYDLQLADQERVRRETFSFEAFDPRLIAQLAGD